MFHRRRRRSTLWEKIRLFFVVSFALLVGTSIGIVIGYSNYNLLQSCVSEDPTVCWIHH